MRLRPQLKKRHTVANILVSRDLTHCTSAAIGRGGCAARGGLGAVPEMGDKWGITICLIDLGLISVALEHQRRGTVLLRELMHVSRELDDKLASSTPSSGWRAWPNLKVIQHVRRDSGGYLSHTEAAGSNSRL
jgi:hypothetical protein